MNGDMHESKIIFYKIFKQYFDISGRDFASEKLLITNKDETPLWDISEAKSLIASH